MNTAPTGRGYTGRVDLTRAAEPWVAYGALVDLEGVDRDDPRAKAVYQQLTQDPRITRLISALETWPGPPLGKAYDAKDSIWQLSMLADFGLRRSDVRIAAIAGRLFAAQATDGGFLHGGFDHTRTWHERPYICVDHVQTYALARFGYCDDPRLQQAYAHILARQRLDGGFHPNDKALPGHERQDDASCPFGTVNVLRALVANPEHRAGEAARRAAEYLLDCWERRAEPYRPVGFGIGATWDKLQYPFVQYQRLKTMDALSQVPGLSGDARYRQLLAELEAKRRPDGTWWADGVNKPYAAFDFGQKRGPSAWITLVASGILQRSA
jgi:hypothetical protein